ncbi:MAG: LuxR C-terminal-related transcriptional regulator [Bacteroidales bacterium]|nr:LuxR C-terminal-related transcriptional regulator [Bacteroidales bacterium]MDY5193358.1 LuxR C-terminal-related transcriptional regulator [Candidatus Aphodosoma sp.]
MKITDDIKHIFSSSLVLDSYSSILNRNFLIVDLSSNEILYVSDKFVEMLCCDYNELLTNSLSSAFNRFHSPNECRRFREIIQLINKLLKANSLHLLKYSFLSLDMNVLPSNAMAILLNHRFFPLSFTEDNSKIKYLMIEMSIPTSIVPFEKVFIYDNHEKVKYRLNGNNWDVIRVKDFTEREILILNMLCNGKTRKEIADTLFCSEETIKKICSNIIKKTNANNMIEAIITSIHLGII